MEIARRIFFLLVLVIVNYSCDKVVDFDINEIEPKLVVNSFFSPDSLIKVYVSLPLSLRESETKNVDNALIILKKGILTLDTLQFLNTGLYSSKEKKIEAGESLEITVSAEGMNSVKASDIVPAQKVIPRDIKIYPNVITDEEGIELNEVQFTIIDPGQESNYYEFKVITAFPDEEQGYSSSFVPYLTSKDPVITIEGDIYYYPKTLLFSDEQFSGLEKTISVYFGNIICVGCPEPDYIIQFKTVSEAYYKYKKKLIRHIENQSGDIWEGEANPVQMYSNVDNGYGIFAAYFQSIDTIKSN